ncbi:DUF917 family protein [Rhizobium sp. BR 314]|uniref:S-methyl thiohydantoin desulfurase domain-containing protein n=1 Tax=Rhizobium sp. BR 314 TaxID=3040013 RepID=UPI0039BFA3D5
MKRTLTLDDIEPAVLGGAILGGGGGGSIDEGLRSARLALEAGTPQLWSPGEISAETLCVTVALVGAPSSPRAHVRAAHMLRALTQIRQVEPRIAAINTNENGAETTVNGWLQSALTGLPVLDLACNGRAHPTGLMGALGLHRMEGYRSQQAYAGGDSEHFVEGLLSGTLERAANIVRGASVEAGGLVAVARNPVPLSLAIDNGAPGAISQAIGVGRALLDGGVEAVVRHMEGEIALEGEVIDYQCERRDGLDIGHATISTKAKLRFINEFMTFDIDGHRIASFPDLIMTFDEEGRPVVSARITKGQRLTVIAVPRAKLLLSSTMAMPELFEPLDRILAASPGERSL